MGLWYMFAMATMLQAHWKIVSVVLKVGIGVGVIPNDAGEAEWASGTPSINALPSREDSTQWTPD